MNCTEIYYSMVLMIHIFVELSSHGRYSIKSLLSLLTHEKRMNTPPPPRHVNIMWEYNTANASFVNKIALLGRPAQFLGFTSKADFLKWGYGKPHHKAQAG